MLVELERNQMNNHFRSYHFDLIKDHGWIWLVTLPFGLVCWVIPFVLLWGLTGTGMEKSTADVIVFLLLGVPALLIGWIFVYSFMEVLITRVSFSDGTIDHRKPLLIFPLVWNTKKIRVSEVESVNLFARYGTRFAILLFLRQGNKSKKYFLPQFKDQPSYLDEFSGFKKDSARFQVGEGTSIETPKKDEMLAVATTRHSNLRVWDAFLKYFSGLLIFILIIGCGYYCLQLPGPAFQLFSSGVSVGMVLVLICLVISIPVLGQGLIWFLGRMMIVWSFGFLNINSDSLFMPVVLQRFFNQWLKWNGGQVSLTDFAFWCFFLLSILYSMDRLVRRFNRRG